jgi:hypothetical protein
MSADIDDDGTDEHSNIHIGERHWNEVDSSQSGDPMDRGTTPSPSLTIEVDYHHDVDYQLMTDVISEVEDNFAFYGMNVTYRINESLSHSDLAADGLEWDDERPPTTKDDADEIEEEFSDYEIPYLYYTTQGGGDWTGTGGRASSDGDGNFLDDFGLVIFEYSSAPPNQTEQIRDTMVHETSHILAAGKNDDPSDFLGNPRERYSGSPADETNETIYLNTTQNQQHYAQWSVMASGWCETTAFAPPINGRYAPYSIEEILTIEFNDVYRETHGRLSKLGG